MAKWGKCDFEQLRKFQKKLEKLSKAETDKYCKEISKELAARLLRKVIKRTPVGVKPKIQEKTKKYTGKTGKSKSFLTAEGARYQKYWSGYVGGTARRGWTAKTEQEAKSGTGQGKDISKWVDELTIKQTGNIYQIDVKNVVNYISYIEYGHRQEPGRYVPALGKKLKKAWVQGKFMLTISEKELNAELPGIIDKKLNELLSEVFSS